MRIYAMSDIHGHLSRFEEALSLVDLSGDNMLILLGDYVHGPDSYGVLRKVMELEETYGKDKVVALLGNHEEMVLDGEMAISEYPSDGESDETYFRWMKKLRRYYKTERQIFCHAGIDEEAGELWEWGTEERMYTWKFPAQTGHFYMDIIAGHISTAAISRNPQFHGIYYDGESHYYIDGSVAEGGAIPVLMVDTGTNRYYYVTKTGSWLILPYDEEN